MAIKIEQSHSKEIIALDNFTALRLRPTLYVGQIAEVEDKYPVIIDNSLVSIDKKISPGFYQLFIEILENSIDEAKRCKNKMKSITVKVNLDTNEIIVADQGLGFHNAGKKHKKTKKNVVRTALEELHAGSNFIDSSVNILGTYGVGSSVVNILSEKFEVETVNKTHYVNIAWEDFKVVKEVIRKKEANETPGTKISFIPSKEIFSTIKWDIDIITTYLSFKSFLIKKDNGINKLEINGFFIKDGKEWDINISKDFIPSNHIVVSTNLGSIYLWESYVNSCSLAFVNGSQCTGIQQKIVNDWCNEYFKYNLAHHFYETMILMNVPSTLMRFSDQNKTKYAVGRWEIEEILSNNFQSKLIKFLSKSEIAGNIQKSIEDRLYNENIGKIRKAQKQSKRRISDKFSPASRHKTNIFLTEGESAKGSILQARDAEHDAIYALRGKVKNAHKLSDLTDNKEILEIMSILDIEPGNNKLPIYEKIIIACDSDPDGEGHIMGLLINLFFKWFPQVIEKKRLYRLVIPLVVCDIDKKRKYFNTLEEFNEFSGKNKISNINYLKGLGSLSPEDWEYVMQNKILFCVIDDRSAAKYMEMAFGENTQKRKDWLQA